MAASQTSRSYPVEHDQELLRFLFASFPEVKKTKVRQWLRLGQVLVNGESTTRFNHSLQPGDVVAIGTQGEARNENLLPSSLRVVFEDEVLVVIEKPERLLSIASESEREKTAYAFLTNYVRRGDPRSAERVWIVHRLDKETSGLMVFAKSESVKRKLQSNWFATGKRYLAIAEGHPRDDQGVLESHLDENGPFRVYSAPPSDRTRHAVTHYRVLRRMARTTLFELELETGRRNQIRVHLADLGCPIVGDEKYGAATNPARRLALHSSSLHFEHPHTGQLLEFESPLPSALARLV